MPETATERLGRVMSMVPYIGHRPGVSLETIAQEYDITVEQVQDDLNLLMVCGLPGYYPDDLIDVVLSDDETSVSMGFRAGLERPVRLTGDEAVALTAALRALAELPGLLDTTAVQSALAKIEQAGGGAAASAVQVSAGEEVPALAVVRAALQKGRRLWMRYYTASRDAVSDRVVDPIRLLITEGHGYLEAYCHTAGAVRNFRIDRIDEATVLQEASQPPLWPETEVPERMFRPGSQTRTVTLLLQPAARWVADYYLVTSSELVPGHDGISNAQRVVLPLPNDEWAIRLVLSLGDGVEIEDRDDLRAEVSRRAAQALARYDDGKTEASEGSLLGH